MNTLPPILNREFKLPEDGKVHLVPLGMYPVEHQGKTIVQVVDDQAVSAMLNHLRVDAAKPNFGGLCADFDHFRHDPEKESRAAAWLDDVEKRQDGLFGAPRWSTSGKAAVEGGDYRFISPEFDPHTLEALGGNKFRPTRLVGFGLTNNPNMRGMAPLSNRSGGAPGGVTKPDADHKQAHHMSKITSLLGLADGADDSQIAGAVEALQTTAGKVPALTNRVNELSALHETLVGESIDADFAAHGITDAAVINRVKPVLVPMKNRQERVEFMALLPKPAGAPVVAKKPLTNRADARTPETVVTAGDDEPTPESTKRDHVIANRARSIRANDKKISQPTAYQMARTQIESEEAARK